MNYEKKLIERLLEQYEKSRFYSTGKSLRRIMLNVEKESWIQERVEYAEEKRQFLDTLKTLKEKGLIDYSWQRYEEGNLVDRIWLVLEEHSIEVCYEKLGKLPTKKTVDKLCNMIEEYQNQLVPGTEIAVFLKAYREEMKATQKIGRFFTEDERMNGDILKCLVYMDQNEEEQMERLMSSRLYGDSKHFEKSVKAKVLSILRHIKKKTGEEIPIDEEILLEKGIVRWPEIMEFAGSISVYLDDGDVIDYGTQKYGSYINSETVKHTQKVKLIGVRTVMFIENKANYIWYITHEKKADELVIFHGGCYSPIKGTWFRMLYEGGLRETAELQYFHWSDIDVGGFRIFHRLRSNIIPELKPYKMDEDTLKKYEGVAIKIQSESYLETLKDFLDDSEYVCFHGVILEMIKAGIRLEQENIIAGDMF